MSCSREALRRLSDRDLVVVYGYASNYETRVNNLLNYYGEVFTPEMAQKLSDSRETLTVARAVGREKCLSGGSSSHKGLRWTMSPSPKKLSKSFGQLLRTKRGV